MLQCFKADRATMMMMMMTTKTMTSSINMRTKIRKPSSDKWTVPHVWKKVIRCPKLDSEQHNFVYLHILTFSFACCSCHCVVPAVYSQSSADSFLVAVIDPRYSDRLTAVDCNKWNGDIASPRRATPKRWWLSWDVESWTNAKKERRKCKIGKTKSES